MYRFRKQRFCSCDCARRERLGLLTPRQKQLRDFVALYVGKNARQPLYKEMRHALGTGSHSYVDFALAKLKLAGALRRERVRP